MIEETEIDGRHALIAYISEDFQPATRDSADMLKVIFDDGEVLFTLPPQMTRDEDVGHPFRGNQFTGGIGSGAEQAKLVSRVLPAIKSRKTGEMKIGKRRETHGDVAEKAGWIKHAYDEPESNKIYERGFYDPLHRKWVSLEEIGDLDAYEILRPSELREVLGDEDPGHPFRGNQYTGGLSGGAQQQLAQRLANTKPPSFEVIKTIRGHKVEPFGILINAPRNDLMQMAKESGYGSLRVMRDEHLNIYAWDANQATHEDVMRELDLAVSGPDALDEWSIQGGRLFSMRLFEKEKGTAIALRSAQKRVRAWLGDRDERYGGHFAGEAIREAQPKEYTGYEPEPEETDEEGNLVGWQTAGDLDVCEVCEDLAADSPYTIDEAQALFPAHINCRCSVYPWWDKRYRGDARN